MASNRLSTTTQTHTVDETPSTPRFKMGKLLAAQAWSKSADPVRAASTSSLPRVFRAAKSPSGRTGRPFRVLCYGDSLTVGFCAKGTQYEPYGQTLAEALAVVDCTACEVSVCGHSGATAGEMVANLNAAAVLDVGGVACNGLGRLLNEAAHAPPDLVLIMAGTNDLGLHRQPKEAFEDITSLHAVCHSRGIATVSLAPPLSPCSLQRPFEAARRQLQDMLAGWAMREPRVVACVDPSELVPAGVGSLWDPDGLHFSPKGSAQLGRTLAPKLLPHALDRINRKNLRAAP